MEDVKFVLKCVAITAVIIMLMQIRIGGRTLEAQAMSWVHRSPVSHVLQDVAEGAVKVTKQGSNAVSGFVKSQSRGSDDEEQPAPTEASSQVSPGGSWFKIKRSAAYYRQKEREKQMHARKQQDDESNDSIEGTDQADRD